MKHFMISMYGSVIPLIFQADGPGRRSRFSDQALVQGGEQALQLPAQVQIPKFFVLSKLRLLYSLAITRKSFTFTKD